MSGFTSHHPGQPEAMDEIAVVIMTRNRSADLARTLPRLVALPEQPDIVVVDNASSEPPAMPVPRGGRRPVRLLRCRRNLGVVARNIGVAHTRQPYVAFSDDDSWWCPGALARAVQIFRDHPRLGLIAGRTLVAPDLHDDPVNADLARGVPAPGAAGPPVVGFLGCAAIVRAAAFRAVGGFHRLLFFVGEERLLAYDLAAAGWQLAYRRDVTAVHAPSDRQRDGSWRACLERRNEVLTDWLRRPSRVALDASRRLVRDARHDPLARRALGGVIRRLPVALADRRPLPTAVEQLVQRLDRPPTSDASLAAAGSPRLG